MTFTGSFNNLLQRMAALDHLEILMAGRKILKNAKRLKIEPIMKMSEVIQLTGMKKEDLEFFSSCRLIEVVETADDSFISFRAVHGLVRIFFRFTQEEVIT